MKKLTVLLLTLLSLACLTHALADGASYGTAAIDGLDADRVHLRGAPSADAPSLGLYFTGTQVTCLSDPAQPWVQVAVGTETGYMMSRYLSAGSVQPKQPAATVSASGGVNLRREPSTRAELITALPQGTALTILGETVDNWYYVQAGGQSGYVMAMYVALRQAGSTSSQTDPTLTLSAADCVLAYVRASNCGVYVHPTDDRDVTYVYDPALLRLDASTARCTNILFFESVTGQPILDYASAAHVYLPRAQYESVTLDVDNGRGYLHGGLDSGLVVYGNHAQLDVCVASDYAGSCLISLTDSKGTVTISESNDDYALNITGIQDSTLDFISLPGTPAYRPGADSYVYTSGSGAAQITADHIVRSKLTFCVMSARWTDQ